MGNRLATLVALTKVFVRVVLTHPTPRASWTRWFHILRLLLQLLRLEWKRRISHCAIPDHSETLPTDHEVIEEKHDDVVVLIGGGHAHLYTLLHHRDKPLPARMILVSIDKYTPYSGMLPGVVAGIYESGDCHIDLSRLCKASGILFIQDRVISLNREQNIVTLQSGKKIQYDYASIDIGSEPRFLDDQDLPPRVTCVKPISTFLAKWEQVYNDVCASGEAVLTIVGGGAGGVEIAFAIQERLTAEFLKDSLSTHNVKVALVTRDDTALPSHNEHVQRLATDLLFSRGIQVHMNKNVVDVKDQKLVCADETEIEFDYCFWCTQAGTQRWIGESGLDVTFEGFALVESTLQCTNTQNIFAVGDCSVMVNNWRPRAGVFAVRQGPILFENFLRILTGEELVNYQPQEEFLALISTGRREVCIASKGDMGLAEDWLFDLKDWIDRSWLSPYKI